MLIKIKGLVFFMILLSAFLTIPNADCQAAINAPGGEASTMEELNKAFGGNHKIKGNKIVLQDDVVLESSVQIKNFKKEVTIDNNSKNVMGTQQVYELFSVYQTKVTFRGKGTYRTMYPSAYCIHGTAPCTITIDGGVFDPLAEKTKIKLSDWNMTGKGDRAKVVLNGGEFSGGNTIDNGSGRYEDFEDDGIDQICPCTDVQINNCTMWDSTICLVSPDKSTTGDVLGKFVYYGNNSINIKKGTGINLDCKNTVIKVKGGWIDHLTARSQSKVYISGGIFNGKGIDILDNSRLVMSNGSVGVMSHITDDECILIQNSTAVFKGGSIRKGLDDETGPVYRPLQCGIRIQGKSTVRISSLTLTADTDVEDIGDVGIYLEGRAKYKPVLYLQGVKGKTIAVTGFVNSFQCSDAYSTVKLKKNTMIESPKAEKKSYSAGQKIPKILFGDMKVSYSAKKN